MALSMPHCVTCVAYEDETKEMDHGMRLHADPRYLLYVTAG